MCQKEKFMPNLDEKLLAKHPINPPAQRPDEFSLVWQFQTFENLAIQLQWKWTTTRRHFYVGTI
jgi:hypothetical protein